MLRTIDAVERLRRWDIEGHYVWTRTDLGVLFPEHSRKRLSATLARLGEENVLRRACRGVYVLREARSDDGRTLERVARALRRGMRSYVSLESALAEYGWLSQIMPDRLTVMTSGRRGELRTPWGVLELIHTERSSLSILDSTVDVGRPLRLATAPAAWRDLKRVGRNTDLVDVGGWDDDDVAGEAR